MPLQVTEIFHSIQGESLHAGRPCVFVRLTGCNLRCRYCDTRYAYEGGKAMEIEEITTAINITGCNLVEITGGEPLLQAETPSLISTLIEAGHEVLVETNGSLDVDLVDRSCCRIMDLKCPGSGESHRNDLKNFTRLGPGDQVKCVLGDRDDYLFAVNKLRYLPQGFPMDHVLFSSVSGQLPPDQLARWILTDRLGVRLHLQLHKIIWPLVDRGV